MKGREWKREGEEGKEGKKDKIKGDRERELEKKRREGRRMDKEGGRERN